MLLFPVLVTMLSFMFSAENLVQRFQVRIRRTRRAKKKDEGKPFRDGVTVEIAFRSFPRKNSASQSAKTCGLLSFLIEFSS